MVVPVRSSRVVAACVLLAVGVLSAGATGAPSATPRSSKRPNIVVLMTDDQTVESLRVMPNVKRLLIDRGASFDNSFVSFPLCCPSRATFLTGQYAHNHGVLSNHPPEGGYEALDNSNTLPVWLQRAGYFTALVGRYLNGYGDRDPNEVPPGWSEWHGAVSNSAFGFYDYTLNEDGRLVRYGNDPAAYGTDVYAQKAVEIVRRRAASEQPFFLWVAFLAPHATTTPGRIGEAALPAPRHLGRFASEPLPRPPSFNEADVSDKPSFVKNLPLLDDTGIGDATERYRLRLESLLAVDDAVAAIVGELATSGELADTLIVFTSDNGFLQGEHRIPAGKVFLYEPSSRVPLVVRGPGVAAGVHLRQVVANIDLAPTIVEAARARAGRLMDGRSLWPILHDAGVFWGRDILFEGPGPHPSSLVVTAVRTPRWVYSEYSTGETELYDLAKDPYELRSLHAAKSAAAERAELARRLAALRRCAGADCRQGAALFLKVRVRGACPVARAVVDLRGPDVRSVVRVQFLLGGRHFPEDVSRPYAAALPLPSAGAVLRVHAFLGDGREVTRDHRLAGCADG
jgi:N-acetylglucosamine-6-sulfatase